MEKETDSLQLLLLCNCYRWCSCWWWNVATHGRCPEISTVAVRHVYGARHGDQTQSLALQILSWFFSSVFSALLLIKISVKLKRKKRAIKLTIWTVDNLTKSSHHHCKWVKWKTHWEMISGTHNKWSTFYYASGEIYN